MTPRELLEQLNELDEHTRVEAKTASDIGKSALQTTYYLTTEKLLALWQAQFPGCERSAGNLPSQSVESPNPAIQITAKSVESATQYVKPPEQASQIAGKAVGRTGQSIQAETQSIQLKDLPDVQAVQVRAVGRRATTPDLIRRINTALCAWRPLSADDLATLLGRTRVHLVNEHLSPMLAAGVLAHTIPEQPSHPQQKYRTITLAEDQS